MLITLVPGQKPRTNMGAYLYIYIYISHVCILFNELPSFADHVPSWRALWMKQRVIYCYSHIAHGRPWRVVLTEIHHRNWNDVKVRARVHTGFSLKLRFFKPDLCMCHSVNETVLFVGLYYTYVNLMWYISRLGWVNKNINFSRS